MAVAHRASTSGDSGTGTALSAVVTKPAGVASGDVLIAAFSVDGATVVTPPAGWTAIATVRRAITAHYSHTFIKVAGGSEPANYTFSFDVTSEFTWGCSAYSGVDNTTAQDATVVTNHFAATLTPATGSITTVTADAMLIAMFSVRGTGGATSTWTAPSGFTERVDDTPTGTGTTAGLSMHDMAAGAAGSKGPYSATQTTSLAGTMQLIVLRPATGSGTPSGTGSISGGGTLAGEGTKHGAGAGSISGGGGPAGSGSKHATGAGAISGGGTLGGSGGSPGSGPEYHAGSGSISGGGSLAGAGVKYGAGSGSFSGGGSLAGSGLNPDAPVDVPQAIEAWVTTPAGAYIAHLDRSVSSPFRAFRFFRERNAPGGGSLEYHLDNALVREHPTLFDKGNLVHMRYRGRERVWAVRDNGSELGASEHAGDWVQVIGPGVWPRRRLVFPPGFAAGTNLNPATWSTQWRRAVNRPAGELLWDLISESNARFATQFTRGTVETTGADGITVDHRFEDIGDDVIPAVLAMRGGDVEFEGLQFNYYRPGHGTDRSAAVIFEEGADLVSLKYTSSRREDSVSWVVGEGVGEGVFAKLAVAENADADRREAFYAAKDAGNVPMLELLTDAALTEHGDDEEALAIEVDESRFRAFDDYDMPDTVRVISPSRGVDRTARLEAIYVAEEDDRVRVAFDLGALRTDEEITLNEKLRQTRSQLGVRNRQPQGQLVPVTANGADVFDSTDTMDVLLDVIEEIYILVRARVTIHFRQFFASAKSATSGGGSTSGASSAASSASGGSSTPTSGASSATSSAGGGGLSGTTELDGHTHTESGGTTSESIHRHNLFIDSHAHTIAHAHVVTIGAHAHTIAHTHTTPDHTHGLVYGVFKEAFPASHSVNLGIYQWSGSSWTLVVSISGLTAVVEEIEVTQYVDGPGLWRFSLQSAAAQPNGGRLAADVSVAVLGAIQSS